MKSFKQFNEAKYERGQLYVSDWKPVKGVEPTSGDSTAFVIDRVDGNDVYVIRHPSTFKKTWGKPIKVSKADLDAIKPKKKGGYRLDEAVEKDTDDPCWKGYVQLGTKKKNGKEVPNCVPVEESVELDEASKEQMLKTYHKYKDKQMSPAEAQQFRQLVRKLKAMGASLKESVDEEVAANSVAGGGVDMNPTGYSKRDKRKREDTDKMYRQNLGLNVIKKIMKERSAK